MPGEDAISNNQEVVAAVQINHNISEKNIMMYQVSMLNNTNEWLEIESAVLNAKEKINILVGDKMNAWIEAKTLEKQVSDYNTQLLLGSIAVSGAAVAVGSNHHQTAQLGAIAMGGAITAASVNDYMNSKNRVEFQKLFPRTHLFNAFTIPPKKVIQRWILVEFEKDNERKSFTLLLKTKNGKPIEISYRTTEEPSYTKHPTQIY